MERLDIRISKELKDKLIDLKSNRGINYSTFIVNAITEKFERLNNPEKFEKKNSVNSEIIQEIKELDRTINLLKVELLEIRNAKRTFEKGEVSEDIKKLIEKQLKSTVYNGNGKTVIPKSTKAIFERLIKDGYNFPLAVVSSTLYKYFKHIKNGKIEGWILKTGEVNGE